jgi:hypothetical protein
LGVLLQGFFFGSGRIAGVPSPLDGDPKIPFWWDHLATQRTTYAALDSQQFGCRRPQKGASGSFSSGYDVFDDYDLGDKDQKGGTLTRYGSREQLERCVAMMRANGIDVYVELVENHRDGYDGHFNFEYVDAFEHPGKVASQRVLAISVRMYRRTQVCSRTLSIWARPRPYQWCAEESLCRGPARCSGPACSRARCSGLPAR